ncbi:MAG: DEAD/DEAH box helicase [SAR324 cluster bacterium]|nr:DEAD/DEAH box helicase [SAR324 cluster bacterium]
MWILPLGRDARVSARRGAPVAGQCRSAHAAVPAGADGLLRRGRALLEIPAPERGAGARPLRRQPADSRRIAWRGFGDGRGGSGALLSPHGGRRDDRDGLGRGCVRPATGAVIVGGRPVRQQIYDIERGSQIIVGTPGRVIDLMQRGVLDFSRLKVVVLDEAGMVDRFIEKPSIDQAPARTVNAGMYVMTRAVLAGHIRCRRHIVYRRECGSAPHERKLSIHILGRRERIRVRSGNRYVSDLGLDRRNFV